MYVLVTGGGKTGSRLAQLLIDGHHDVRVIEQRPAVIERLRLELPAENIIFGDGDDPGVLISAGIRKADVLAAVTGGDEDNLVACTLARFEFMVPRTIARVNNPKNAWLFTPDMGVDVALDQAELMAHLVAEEMSLGDMMTLLKLRKGEFSLVEEKVAPGAPADGARIADLRLPDRCVLSAIIRKGEIIIPRGSVVLQANDEVIGLAHESELERLAELLGTPRRG